MKCSLSFLLLLCLLSLTCQTDIDLKEWKAIPDSTFLKSQLEFPRVRTAFQKKKTSLQELLLKHGIQSFDMDLFLRAFKQEAILEVWAKPKGDLEYQLIEVYDFCRNSGTLGPKRKEGDRQIPEGFYRISHYNPKSSYLLSLKVNYPNAADKILSDSERPGGDIYIHGGCQTVGCIPVTDDKIQELYSLTVLAKKEGVSIPIHIFPFKMTNQNTRAGQAKYPHLEIFWDTLKKGFDYFEKEKNLPKVEVTSTGAYETSD